VLGADTGAVEAAVSWRTERRVRNPQPERGLASSLQVGLAGVDPDVEAVLILLGDQPLVSVDTIRALLDARREPDRPIVVPVYADDTGRNPVLVVARRSAWSVMPRIAAQPAAMVTPSHPRGAGCRTNPDVDTPADLARAIQADWAARVRVTAARVERSARCPMARLYADVASGRIRRGRRSRAGCCSTWFDPARLARRRRRRGALRLPIAVRSTRPAARSSPSTSAVDAGNLREIADDYASRTSGPSGRWPPSDPVRYESDVVLIAHVAYDIEAIGLLSTR
jgi:CTP:molybdopterin cytidylyltransferase MocA